MDTNKMNDGLLSTFIKIIASSLAIVVGVVYGVQKICYTEGENNIPIYSVETEDKKLSLTFDVGWDNPNLEELLDVLDKYNIKATFFVTGNWVDENEELMKMIHEKGHDIGNHSNTHANATLLSNEMIKEEIQLTTQKIEEVINVSTNLYRPPYGDVDDNVIDICDELGYKVVNWSVDSLDWKEIGHNYIVDRVTRNAEAGSIILFHTSTYGIDKYVDEILVNLDNKGYEVVSINELVYEEDYIIDSNGVQKTQ